MTVVLRKNRHLIKVSLGGCRMKNYEKGLEVFSYFFLFRSRINTSIKPLPTSIGTSRSLSLNEEIFNIISSD
ncbi:MAG: hypothetical protein ACC656_06245, partial [Candidatus Heimdallarchaeota archaeon]